MPYVTVSVDLDDFDEDDILEEAKRINGGNLPCYDVNDLDFVIKELEKASFNYRETGKIYEASKIESILLEMKNPET